MPLFIARRLASPAAVIAAVLLSSCSIDRATDPLSPSVLTDAVAGPGVAGCTPGSDNATQGHGLSPDPVLAVRCAAKAGDLIDVRLEELHPTQPSLGYDEVYYKLGRYLYGKDVINKKFDDWCEANGQEKATSASPDARLDDPTSFACTVAIGSETQATMDVMKTVVVGPRGELFLTDGHHTFTSFWETPDGGPKLHVRARVEGNLSHLSAADFWREMQNQQWVWLYDADEQAINVQQLPRSLGLSQFGNDVYRGVLYFARDIGYQQLASNAIFQEFYWGRWLRGNAGNSALNPFAYDLYDLASYLGLVREVSMAQTALNDGDIVSDGKTALQLGKLALWNDGKAVTSGEFGKLSKPYTDLKPGKIAYALKYKGTVALASTHP
jgi:hypothetical protein